MLVVFRRAIFDLLLFVVFVCVELFLEFLSFGVFVVIVCVVLLCRSLLRVIVVVFLFCSCFIISVLLGCCLFLFLVRSLLLYALLSLSFAFFPMCVSRFCCMYG